MCSMKNNSKKHKSPKSQLDDHEVDSDLALASSTASSSSASSEAESTFATGQQPPHAEAVINDDNEPDEAISAHDEAENTTEHENTEPTSVKIEFPYSDLVRARIPKAFEVAEKVATDWKNEGDFSDLGLPHPLADVVASQALKKAKEVEKKLEEKGVFTVAKMGLQIAKMQIDQLNEKIKKKSS